MAVQFGTTTRGAAELVAALNSLERVAQGKAIRSALRSATYVIHDATVDRAPILTGKMKRALTVRAGKRSRKGFSYRVIFSKSKSVALRKQSKKSNDVWFYPAVVEYGDHDTPAHPFMRPAFDAKKGEALDVFAGKLRYLIFSATRK